MPREGAEGARDCWEPPILPRGPRRVQQLRCPQPCLSSPFTPRAGSQHSHLPSCLPKSSPKHSPSRYTQRTLPDLLCPSKLNSSRALGRAACPDANAGEITLNTQAKPHLVAFSSSSSWGSSVGWDEEGCSGAEEGNHVPADWHCPALGSFT